MKMSRIPLLYRNLHLFLNVIGNLTIGFDLVELEVLEGAGPIDVCIGTTNSTFLYGGITLGVIIPVVYENGKYYCLLTIRLYFCGVNKMSKQKATRS